MATFFKAADVAKAAVEIEKKGEAFYRHMAEQTKDEELRDLFIHLAGEEHKHELIFSNLLTRLGSVELPAWSTTEEYGEYIDALISSHTLFDSHSEALMAGAGDAESGVRVALSFEKDTLLFFVELKELVPDSEKDAVQRCVDEERLHIRKLRAML
ncbi:ferritin-like domain-containing protein [Fundidesulfovibrio soli]|uniref:ferritin-like domain-containing protein n=1 Tax=Fundidesulfovibrio soli TaxID=2922716 RepID=UPI001FB0234F|nr:ferritin family protein [Fundidesulfovibrio soli]